MLIMILMAVLVWQKRSDSFTPSNQPLINIQYENKRA